MTTLATDTAVACFLAAVAVALTVGCLVAWVRETRRNMRATVDLLAPREPAFIVLDAPTLADALGLTDDAAYSWDPHRLPLSQSPIAQRIREQIADNECRRFRAELDGWGA